MLNYDALPTDSMLVLETTVTFHGSNDTFIMKRWFATPTMMRLEVYHGDTLTTGLCTNGGARHREYSHHNQWWNESDHNTFHRKMDAYDFRGPLYNWQLHGIKLSYMGTAELKGQPLQVVRAQQEQAYTRYYMFEEQSGLMVLMQEKDDDSTFTTPLLQALAVKPIDYKVVHEYSPAGASLIMSEESYMRDGLLTFMHTKAHFEPRNNLLFNQD